LVAGAQAETLTVAAAVLAALFFNKTLLFHQAFHTR
jgi:hypothetical protein